MKLNLPRRARRRLPARIKYPKRVAWCEGMPSVCIASSPANRRYAERFNGSFRHEVLDAHIFGLLSEVREIVHD